MKNLQVWVAVGGLVLTGVLSFVLDWERWVLAIVAFPLILVALLLAARSERRRASIDSRPVRRLGERRS